MLEDFIKYLQENKLSENTYQSYVSDVKTYAKYYKDSYGENFSNLDHSDIQSYIYFLKNHLNRRPSTINRHLSSLKIYNEFLISKHIQDNMAISKRDFIKIQPCFVKEDLPEVKQMQKLCHAAKDEKRDFCLITLAIYGGSSK